MDFLNHSKQRQNKLQLIVGYVLVAIAVMLTTVVLLFAAYGYGLGKNGQIIQNGLVFVSSVPSPAQIYLNGKLVGATNQRLQLPTGQYTMVLKRNGYRTWVRSLGVEGGSVEHFDYPFLFPTNLVTTAVQQYSAQPDFVLQSPDQNWLLAQQPGSGTDFTEYDLTKPKQLATAKTTVSIPANLLTNDKPANALQLVGWADDNRHVLLKHDYAGGSEYILFDRHTPANSLNLTKTLNLGPNVQLSLNNDKYDQYYLFDPAAGTLQTASLSVAQPVSVLDQVLAYKSYGSNVLLYATSKGAAKGMVNVDVLQGTTNSLVRQEPAGIQYLLDLTQYNGNWYVVVGATTDDKVYVYENPMAAVQSQPGQPLVPAYILKVNSPDYVQSSTNAQFILAEGGSDFAVYDAENQKGYAYTVPESLAPGQHADWMDGDRLVLTSGGKVEIFDYDHANPQTLQPVVNGAEVFFDAPYKWAYNLAPASTSGQFALTQTALRIPADQ